MYQTSFLCSHVAMLGLKRCWLRIVSWAWVWDGEEGEGVSFISSLHLKLCLRIVQEVLDEGMSEFAIPRSAATLFCLGPYSALRFGCLVRNAI